MFFPGGGEGEGRNAFSELSRLGPLRWFRKPGFNVSQCGRWWKVWFKGHGCYSVLVMVAFWECEPSVARSSEFFQKQPEIQIMMADNSNDMCTHTPTTFEGTLLAGPIVVLFLFPT